MSNGVQVIDLARPILSGRKGYKPLFFNVAIQSADLVTEGGTVQSNPKQETYVLLSGLPRELQLRIQTAIQTIQSTI
jgi:hypothetical protein